MTTVSISIGVIHTAASSRCKADTSLCGYDTTLRPLVLQN